MHAVDETLALDVGRDTVEDEVAERVGHEMEIAVAREVGKLPIDGVAFLLQRDHVIVVLLELPFIEQRRIEGLHAERRETGSWPGLLGIWNSLIVLPEIQLSRVLGLSSVET